ncbi:hypothetical protein BUALT_Bualt07G0030200 [Buddleja alternifolia]|uniref:NB-ARC domain-containing protein n=1 Tax=Buddleja alternifolia TaxID=168488 RepID=A0AAV6X7S2_9LAMI|nr:hypothetical protein BUALT_Bualt07G0030200 [Buddleja alternifolia]
MAVAAYAYVTSLLHVLDQVQHPARRRLLPNPKQIETLHEKVHFLQEFLELHSATKIEGMEDLMKQITEEELFTMDKAEGKAAQEQQPPTVSVRAGSSTLLPPRGNNRTHVVGFDERLVRVMDELTGNQRELEIIPIVGMGGIGKTTLARFAFENKCVVEKFDVRVWFTISQEYSAHEILLGILSDIGISGYLNSDLKSETLAELGLRLYKYLFCRRYLIVMDDLWSTKGWDDFKLSFPNDVNGSRVMVTSRLKDVAASLGSHNTYTMDFLDEDNSWNLLCEKAFTQGSSPDLEEIGKKIAKGCKGLPLAIVVIGGLLAKSNMTREYWEFVAGKVANEYLKDFIDRNLILIRRRGDLGDITGCGVHDLLRDLWRSKDIVGPRSAELFGCLVGHPNPHLVRLRFCEVREDMFYEKLPLYTKLRYLFLHTPHLDPLSLSTIIQLWKLQTLCILSVLHTLVLPSEIWEMPQLMHIIIHKDFYLPQIERKDDFIVLENLHTLVKIREFRCTEDVVKRIPNLKELKIEYYERDWSYYCLHNIANLRKLESLVLHKWKFTCGNIAFPYSLKKLVLYWCIIPWEDMTVIHSLPNLEVLQALL